MSPTKLSKLSEEIVKCRACPRLVKWREHIAEQKRAAFKDEEYWGKPVPGFGDPKAKILIVGLAPAAHGANRTGRMFTGDRSGDWLYDALYRAKLANQSKSVGLDDGLKLRDVYITSPVKCAPPANKPTTGEQAACQGYIKDELEALKTIRVFLVLGHLAYNSMANLLNLKPKPKFKHGQEVQVFDERFPSGRWIVCSYHVSQQNTFTGKLTRPMFDKVIARSKKLSSIR